MRPYGQSGWQFRSRIRVGDEHTLLSVAGLHLLTGHVGKGQQFGWVVIIGVEEACIPDFRVTTRAALIEEARILSVMISRARHGVVVTRTKNVPAQSGKAGPMDLSGFLSALVAGGLSNASGITAWLGSADWTAIAKR